MFSYYQTPNVRARIAKLAREIEALIHLFKKMHEEYDATVSESPSDALTKRHKQERKDLQAQIQMLKKSATKGDKKKKKDVQEEIIKLEAEIEHRQKKEEEELEEQEVQAYDKCEDDRKLAVQEEGNIRTDSIQQPKMTKAQKRREKKTVVSQERVARIQAQEVENLQGPRHKEIAAITEMLKKRDLAIHSIAADGNCLYSAVEHQLKQDIEPQGHLDYKALRKLTADHLRTNPNDFLPFLSNFETGDQMSERDYEEYCLKVEKTTAWGGQIELRALANVLHRPIEVIQATGPSLTIGEEFMSTKKPVTVTFHRFMYRLGEHYNSVTPYVQDDEQEN